MDDDDEFLDELMDRSLPRTQVIRPMFELVNDLDNRWHKLKAARWPEPFEQDEILDEDMTTPGSDKIRL